ncbi:MAG: AMP-binding protein [Actinobacteria bacterium]|nr:AMP-binding protein [Actinomycetota bacterium]MBU1943004.1 AMP-binding protein [Actinomycetota bacterium]MBU2687756.1 AMP-binding protein [Actinomycetota bacterium]
MKHETAGLTSGAGTVAKSGSGRFRRKIWVVYKALVSLGGFIGDELKRGTLRVNLKSIWKARGVSLARDMSPAELLEEKAAVMGDAPFLYFEDEVVSYADMDRNANRLANFLLDRGGGPGRGVAVMMGNSPVWLDVFFGMSKAGMYAVPVNTALMSDQLAYIIDNSDAGFIVIDYDLVPQYQAVADRVPGVQRVLVNAREAPCGYTIPEGMEDLSLAYGPLSDPTRPSVEYNPEDLCVIMYTSGTTGLPKGVMYRYGSSNVKALAIAARLLYEKGEVSYTCYPLFHGNALFLTVITSLHVRGRVALSRKFSASRFWDEVRRYGATTFNGLGAVMPILMKQPAKSNDADNEVRYVFSAGCPASIWEDFEKRFDLKIIEGYGAVDGGGALLLNLGTAPVGSMGKPIGTKCRVVDPEGNEVPPGTTGEMICEVGSKKSSMQYYKNAGATNEKVRDGWLYSGDLVYQDEEGYYYFVGRNTESMRVKGENVSAFEVEQAIGKHPDVLECAAYAVPSDLAEDEIMACVVPVEGRHIDPAAIRAFLSDKLAKFAIPRYWRVMDEIPKTETHRAIKSGLEKAGVTEDTFDSDTREKEACSGR